MKRLESLSDPESVKGMAKFGINPDSAYGVSIPDLRRVAREIGKDHGLALDLWSSGVHEARILASMIDRPVEVTEEQTESWAGEFDSWDICDQCCNNLFYKTKFAFKKAKEWSRADREFVKRAGFAMIACLAVHADKKDEDNFLDFLPIIKRESTDERNFVKKAVNWVLRQIGKRSVELNRSALETAEEIRKNDSKTARWISSDAIRELTSEAVRKKLRSGN